jgi:hypothetical protein
MNGTPAPKSPGAGSFVTVVLGVILAGVIGFGAAEWRNRPSAQDFESVTLPENALKLPKEVDLIVGEPRELRAETRGRKVMWLPLEKEVKMVPIDSKAVWVWTNEKGDYRVVAWTSVNGLPTPNQLTVLHAKSP